MNENPLVIFDFYNGAKGDKIMRQTKLHIDAHLERLHMDTAKRRREEIRSGDVKPIDCDQALARVRRLVWQELKSVKE